MRKFVIFALFMLLSIAGVSNVLADYQLPSDTIDIIQPDAPICLPDAPALDGEDAEQINNRVSQEDCDTDPCTTDVGSNHVDNRALVGDDCDDPCVTDAGSNHVGGTDDEDPCILPDPCKVSSDELSITRPETISFNYSEEAAPFDSILGLKTKCREEKGESPKDTDGDGIFDFEDNCPYVPNADQANTYGTQAGNACEESYRSDNGLVWGFVGEDYVGFWGFCGEDGCQHIVTVAPSQFGAIMAGDAQDAGDYAPELAGGKVLNIEDGPPKNMTVLFQVGTDADGNPIYQINVYLIQQQLVDGEAVDLPVLVDDDFTVTVDGDGNWTWYDKHPN